MYNKKNPFFFMLGIVLQMHQTQMPHLTRCHYLMFTLPMVLFITILHLTLLHQNLIVKTFEVHHYVSKVVDVWVPSYIVIHHFKSMLDFVF
jgi:hypothetical protein